MAAGIAHPTAPEKGEEREDSGGRGVPLVFRDPASFKQRRLDAHLGREDKWASYWAAWAEKRRAAR